MQHATAPPAGGVDDPDSLVRTSTRDRADHAERALAQMQAQMAEMQRKMQEDMQAQMAAQAAKQADKLAEAQALAEEKIRRAQQERDEALRIAQLDQNRQHDRAKNIKERLDSGEWKEPRNRLPDGQSQQWWGTGVGDDRSVEVNRLRALAKVRAQWPQGTFAKWPQLVVMGDGNTGKSTVLNRFAQFNFSAVSDGICTRRPIRLELRPMSNANRPNFHEKNLDAMVSLHDMDPSTKSAEHPDGFTATYEFRTSHRVGRPDIPDGEGPDEDLLRYEVEARASKTPPVRTKWEQRRLGKMTAAEKHDAQYCTDELIIRYEAPGMIHFDLIDLPGIDNGSPVTDELVQKYINRDTLAHTFMLIFQAATRGDTRMQYSLCLKHVLKLADAAAAASSDWLKSHCLGEHPA